MSDAIGTLPPTKYAEEPRQPGNLVLTLKETSSGEAIKGVKVSIAGASSGEATTDAAGQCRFDGIAEGVVVLNEQNQISDFNRAAASYIDGLSATSVGRWLEDLPAGRVIAAKLASQLTATQPSANPGIEVSMTSEGGERVFEVRLTPLLDRTGILQCKALLLLDVTEKRRLLEQLELQAHTDPLTGLLNRRQLEAEAGRMILLAGRTATPLSLAVVDLDKFKTINDTYGHEEGDVFIQTFASYLTRILTENSFLARFGGDEFVIVQNHATWNQLEQMNLQLQTMIDTYNQTADHPLSYAVGYELSCKNHYYYWKNNIDADILSWVHDEIVDRIAEDIVDTVSESKHKIMVDVANKYLHNVEIDCEMTILPHWTK